MAGDERKGLTLKKIKEILGCEVITGEDLLDISVETAGAADMMSDVLAFTRPGALLITGLITPQAVMTSDVVDVKAILYVRGKIPLKETIVLAREKNIPILATHCHMFETCGRLFVNGLKPSAYGAKKKNGA
ncbi:MAG: transcriptional regulator [Deltaproteobacteria bacterium]|nr:transcriptional regulator [Deltaproteobacteria bacterium]